MINVPILILLYLVLLYKFSKQLFSALLEVLRQRIMDLKRRGILM